MGRMGRMGREVFGSGNGLRESEFLGLVLMGFPGFCDRGWGVWQDAILPVSLVLLLRLPPPLFFSALSSAPLHPHPLSRFPKTLAIRLIR